MAYLRQGAGATLEFQKILNQRGVSRMLCHYPLAQLGLARAAALKGDAANSRMACQDFFALRKDADAGLPLLQQARQEYEKL